MVLESYLFLVLMRITTPFSEIVTICLHSKGTDITLMHYNCIIYMRKLLIKSLNLIQLFYRT